MKKKIKKFVKISHIFEDQFHMSLWNLKMKPQKMCYVKQYKEDDITFTKIKILPKYNDKILIMMLKQMKIKKKYH